MMDDENLHNVISELSSCRFISDKISIVKEQVHSLGDLIEVLNICFWYDECVALFNSLDNIAIAVLLNFLYQKYNENQSWQSESGWEIELSNYMKIVEWKRRTEIEDIVKDILNKNGLE